MQRENTVQKDLIGDALSAAVAQSDADVAQYTKIRTVAGITIGIQSDNKIVLEDLNRGWTRVLTPTQGMKFANAVIEAITGEPQDEGIF